MQVVVVTVPIRSAPTSFPPLGALSIVNYLRHHGCPEVTFLDVDFLRLEMAEVIGRLRELNPGVVGISAVVSTSYAYVKQLTAAIKAALPETLVVVGGNMAAAAEVLLRKARVDLCVLGEGEITFRNIVARAETTRRASDFADIPGLALLDGGGKLLNTGYELALDAKLIWDVDWSEIEREGATDHFFPPAFSPEGVAQRSFRNDPRTYQPQRRHKRFGQLTIAKGCVSRCTFCHRWDKGLRHIPLDEVFARLDHMIERYDVGFIQMVAESFGNDKRWLDRFITRLAEYDVLWVAGGVRTSTFDDSWIPRLKASGCCSLVFGNETGSETMLEVMEKKVSLQDNYDAMRRTVEAGLFSPMQFVIGMPGETSRTIAETIRYAQFGTTLADWQNPTDIGVNYAQALPGTPLYEYGRHQGLIGRDLDAEEGYLLKISNVDAHDEEVAINFTGESRLTWLSWRTLINVETYDHFARKFGDAAYYAVIRRDLDFMGGQQSAGDRSAELTRLILALTERGKQPPLRWLLKLIANGMAGMAMVMYPRVFHRIRILIPLLVLAQTARKHGPARAWALVLEQVRRWPGRHTAAGKAKSLRKTVEVDLGPLPDDPPEMLPLRRGR